MNLFFSTIYSTIWGLINPKIINGKIKRSVSLPHWHITSLKKKKKKTTHLVTYFTKLIGCKCSNYYLLPHFLPLSISLLKPKPQQQFISLGFFRLGPLTKITISGLFIHCIVGKELTLAILSQLGFTSLQYISYDNMSLV